jgi:hypothetical protein
MGVLTAEREVLLLEETKTLMEGMAMTLREAAHPTEALEELQDRKLERLRVEEVLRELAEIMVGLVQTVERNLVILKGESKWNSLSKEFCHSLCLL